MTWLERVAETSAIVEFQKRIHAGGHMILTGGSGSSLSAVCAAAVQNDHPILLVVAHLDEADEARDELEGFGITVAKWPALEVLPGETSPAVDLLGDRLSLLRQIEDDDCPAVIVAPIAALMQSVPTAERVRELVRVIRIGTTVDTDEFATWLTEVGYVRVETIETAGEFAIRGGIIDLFPPGGAPCRIDLFGDDVDALYEVDLATMGSDRRVDSIELLGVKIDGASSKNARTSFVRALPDSTCVVLGELSEMNEQARSYYDRVADADGIFSPSDVLKTIRDHAHIVVERHVYGAASGDDSALEIPARALPVFAENAAEAVAELGELASDHDVLVCVQNDGEAARMGELIEELIPGATITVLVQYIHRGYVWEFGAGTRPIAIVPYHELMHRYHTRRRVRRISGSKALDSFVDLEPGDYVVHRDHGIAQFTGLRTLKSKGAQPAEEYMTLEFAKNAKLNVPVTHIDLVQKYIGAFHGRPELSTLGGKRWKMQKERVADAVHDLAAEMLRMQAVREAIPGIRYPADTTWQQEFEAEFPYDETEDQVSAIRAIKKDMTGPRPMDRLVCGDVGFGKTEVAIRAAFKAVEFGKQAAVLVPTTVLAEQHERTFRDRFADYPFRIEALSRFKTKKEQTEILKQVRTGEIDVIIGTHRLLSKDVHFSDLGMVIIDEEQRFGVEHKQRLLEFRTTAEVLTLSATPIPRT
ncbi:MAG: DEAD/DEAH box helicase, partial [Planctomycetota bacterium]